ncbi:MAG: sugar transporter [Prevotella sp.]|nr:sugar transporter [Prevotella sp.]
MPESRVRKSLLNAKVNLVFYFLSLFFAFFSRKIFLDCLGAEFIGLTGTLGNILGYLNLAELGVGAAISFHLFKPIQQNNRQQICDILSVFGYLYKRIGQAILLGGIIISLFFPLLFNKEELGMGIIYFAFYSFLGSSLIGYFINYRQILLSADQKNYLVSIYFQSAGLVKTAMQILLAYYYKNLYVWVFIEFLFGIIGCVILNWKINKEYPWLKTSKANGKVLLKQYPEIIKNTKQVFIHKIKDFLLGRSDELFIYAFVSLKMVAFYGNYMLIIAKLSLFFSSIFDGINAGVGNLVAEGNKNNTMKVFWELMFARHFLAGFMVFSLYTMTEPFVSLWLGSEYIMSHNILVLLMIYLYISHSRSAVDMFNHAHGLYADTWSAWAELIINISVTVIFGLKYGIIGILLGKILSVIPIVIFWKPYYLFRSGLQLPYREYWQGAIRFYAIFAVSFMICYFIGERLPIDPYIGYGQWILYGICLIPIYVVINVLLLYICTPGARTCIKRIPILRNKIK